MNSEPKEHYENKGTIHWTQFYTVCILHLILTIIAAKLAWSCNINLNIILRLFNTFISALFSELYILYFAVYRIFLGNSCI